MQLSKMDGWHKEEVNFIKMRRKCQFWLWQAAAVNISSNAIMKTWEIKKEVPFEYKRHFLQGNRIRMLKRCYI